MLHACLRYHHTDTSLPFRTYLRSETPQKAQSLRDQWLSAVDFKRSETIDHTVLKLDHDEHIVAALKTDIIDSAFVVAQNAQDTDAETFSNHRIACAAVDRKNPSTGLNRSDCDTVLESTFLNERIAHFEGLLSNAGEEPLFSRPYILDIDLDYLNTLNSVLPKDASTLKSIAKNAGLITVAQESRHVRLCAFDDNVTSEYLLPRLEELLRN